MHTNDMPLKLFDCEMKRMEKEKDQCYLLDKASRILKCKINCRLAEIGLTFPQFLIIEDIYKIGMGGSEQGAISPASIADRANYERATVTGIIDRLVRDGFVNRETNPSDRRSQMITLTQKAKDMIKTMDSYFEEVRDKSLRGFDDSEKACLMDYLLRMIGNLENK
jgi:DNA-binding MarR family transcriptional regulator